MELKKIQDRQALAEYFNQDIALHFYSLGDLDDFYWSDTTCLGLITPTGIDNVSVIYKGKGLPVLLAFDQSGCMNQDYIDALIPYLPDRFDAHLSPGLEERFSTSCSIHKYGGHYKMRLQDPSSLDISGLEKVIPLTEDDLPAIRELFDHSYPDNAFDPRMVLSRKYFGYREQDQLVCAGGIHVYSQKYKVAALGNITTHPDFRNQGLGRLITARICQELWKDVDFIGLNVMADNKAAIHLYQTLGFKISSTYGEFSFKKGHKPSFSL